ncbi:SusC/RagA family TonB-linked outer membrane protein [Tellurirhabdus rosea]|uniref:SusC/RagA family TonB-linked outer membrane protein n=1 Tax=Tellurirhabdus rosea TaxID=2674997 RepID=UPI00224CB367|nr:SusC/RagA family TonB-linked outer membrane protein [Tellurirhabdus rosea]
MVRNLWVFVCLLFSVTLAVAQERTLSGRVTTGPENAPLPGANVVAKGSSRGTTTDADGAFRLTVPGDTRQLVISSVGHNTQEVEIGTQTVFNVKLQEDSRQLNEVVVTALGIRQEKRALNYSLQEVKADEIIRAREPNVVNALNGKAAGVQIISQGGSPGAAASINIRGKSSFQGNSQPLFVVDGIPVNNSYRSTGLSSSVDNSNRAVDINPDDIESISVLKGPAATALYGIQAGSGVVLITTKKGSRSDTRRTTVTFNSTASVEQVNKLFPLQDVYAQGTNGAYSDAPGQTFIFGPRISDLRYSSSLTDPRYPQGKIVPATDPTANASAPVQVFDNQRNFYQTGRTFNNHLSISSGNRNGNLYFSIGRLTQEGVIPLNTFDRTTAKLSGETELSPKLRLSSSLTYINSGGQRVGRGDNFVGVTQGIYRTPPHFDIFNGQDDPTNPVAFQFPNGSQRHYRNQNQIDGMNPADAGLGPDSPLWTINKNPYRDRVDRLQGYVQLNYQILPWLGAMFRAGADVFADRRVHAFDIGSFGGDGRFGRIFEDTYINKTFNTDFLLTADKKFGDIGLTALVGHNFFNNDETRSYLDGNTFNQPGLFNISNATVIANPLQSRFRRRTFAAFASAKLDYQGWAFLEGTVRNEWASTLPEQNNSFLYPSVSGGVILTDALKLNSSVLSYLKIRGSYAQVGNIPEPYQTETFYVRASASDGFGNGISFPIRGSNIGGSTLGNQIGNPDLLPENNSTLEFGADLGFFENRIRLDATYYRSRNRNQIIAVPMASSSGFTSKRINAGELENKGIEAILTVIPVKTSSFQWEASFNFTRNRNLVVSTVNNEPILLPGFGTIFQPRLVPGQQFGVFYGSGWRRNEAGQILIGNDGFPIRQDNLLIGNPNPDFLLGIRNSLSFKGLTLSFLWDIRQGGDVWNGTEAVLTNIGATMRTLERGQQRVFEGVRQDGTPNTQAVTLTQANWFQANGRATGAAGVHEQFIEDASWVRLRDVNLSYRLPAKWFGNGLVKGVELTAFGRNLLLFTKYSGVDPENSLYGLSPAQGLDYFGNPNTRSAGLSLNATF